MHGALTLTLTLTLTVTLTLKIGDVRAIPERQGTVLVRRLPGASPSPLFWKGSLGHTWMSHAHCGQIPMSHAHCG